MQKIFDIVADLDTPVSAYLKLRDFQPRFLLESVERGEHLARYSFIGLGEAVKLRLDRSGLSINGELLGRPANQRELLDGFRKAVEMAPKLSPAGAELPFRGGLVGAAGYDVVRYFERLGQAEPGCLETPVALYLAPRSVLVFDHLTRRMALLHEGDTDQREALKARIIEALRGAIPKRQSGGSYQPAQPSMTPEQFKQAVLEAQGNIHAGDVYQLVLSVAFQGVTDLPPFDVYRALRLLNPSPYMYFCELDDVTVAGSSPEALVRLHGNQAALRPIAGTRPRGNDSNEDREQERALLADPKEAAEHVMLVDLARNDLGRVALTGTVHVDPYRAIERYSHVMHLVSGVKGTLADGKDALDLFAAAFPAGTLVGAPKVRAMELIDHYEPVGRGFYAGTVGYFGTGGDMDQAIAIRTIVFQGGKYCYQAGAGIVADSQPQAEYEEVLAKSRILRRALAMAQEGL
ncbi:MAG: anthranilate synthase component I family protein [Gammaproteobacteria bacterium]|nr:anthranilate synthase component I family protein [Gammaproteobacteria bacterium]